MKLKEIKPGMAVKCRTKEEATALWTWFYDNGYIRYGNGADGLDNFIRCFPDCCFGINKSENSWDTYGENEKDVEKVEFSDLVIPELTAEEVLQLASEICDENSCIKCPMNGNCYRKITSNKKKIIEIVSKWKSDHEKEDPEIEWVYRVFGAENYGEKFFHTEEEAIKRCEELAMSQKTKQYARYERVCRAKAVK